MRPVDQSDEQGPCATCQPGTRALCRTPDLRALIGDIRTGTQVCAKGDVIIRQGAVDTNVLILLEGWIALSEILSDGRKQILSFALPGDVLGHLTLGMEAPFMAEALTPVKLCALPRSKLAKIAQTAPSVAVAALNVIETSRISMYSHLATVGRRSAKERVAALLLELFLRNGGDLRVAWRMTLPLTQAHMADALGLTLVHTNRMLRGLSRDGLISASRGRLRVLAPLKLLHAAGFDSADDPQISLWHESGLYLFKLAMSPKKVSSVPPARSAKASLVNPRKAEEAPEQARRNPASRLK